MKSFRQILIVVLLFASVVLYAGFPAETLVKISSGIVDIAKLKIGDSVESYDSGTIVNHAIICQKSTIEKGYIVVEIENDIFISSNQQQFYIPKEKIWKTAQQLKAGDALLKNNDKHVIVKSIVIYDQSLELFDISVKDSHNYFVSNTSVLTHNFEPFIMASFAFGGGGIVFNGVAAGLTAACGLIGLNVFKGKHRGRADPQIIIETPFGQTSCGGSPGPLPDPNDDKDKKKNEENSKTKSIDNENSTNPQFPEQESQIRHLFTERKGHLPDTQEYRQKIFDIGSNENNFLVTDKWGKKWYAEITPEGEQYWVAVKDGIIENCGKNKTPRIVNPETGLCRNPFK